MKLSDNGGDGGITVNDLLMKAAAAAMKTVPAANSSWLGDKIRVYDSVDINVVVGSGSDLYAPVIRDVGRRGLKAISDDAAAAASVVEGGGPDGRARIRRRGHLHRGQPRDVRRQELRSRHPRAPGVRTGAGGDREPNRSQRRSEGGRDLQGERDDDGDVKLRPPRGGWRCGGGVDVSV